MGWRWVWIRGVKYWRVTGEKVYGLRGELYAVVVRLHSMLGFKLFLKLFSFLISRYIVNYNLCELHTNM